MKLIQTQTLASAGASITFSDIPQDFTDLYILCSLRGDTGVIYVLANLFFNGSTSGFSSRGLEGNGSSASSYANATIYINAGNGGTSTANTFSNHSLYVPNYTSSTAKSVSVDGVMENNATAAYSSIQAGLWTGTAAITSLAVTAGAGSQFVAGSTVSLYGIGGVGDGWAPKATGGVISRSGDYYVHTFTASGTFTPTAALSNVEYVVVAGGGGGGRDGGGGGGAGGYRSSVVGESSGGGASAETRLSLASGTNYTVTVGAGGAGGTSNTGVSGANSVFGDITATGGGGGGGDLVAAITGGSGGGGRSEGNGGGASVAGAAGTSNQGYGGGSGAGLNSAGGGGGAGQVGGPAFLSHRGGTGGNGVQSSITGTATFRAGGGGGGVWGSPGDMVNSIGGSGGGGIGQVQSTGTAGSTNTGGGGGGGSIASGGFNGGAGGSGIVIVRYLA
jgi:hypothetical protein